MAEAPHGTAPRLFGKNVANPLAMILAAGALLSYVDDRRAANASRAIYESTLEAVHEGIATADLGGSRDDDRVHGRGHRRRQAQARRLVDSVKIP